MSVETGTILLKKYCPCKRQGFSWEENSACAGSGCQHCYESRLRVEVFFIDSSTLAVVRATNKIVSRDEYFLETAE